jgi:hypothetical protein
MLYGERAPETRWQGCFIQLQQYSWERISNYHRRWRATPVTDAVSRAFYRQLLAARAVQQWPVSSAWIAIMARRWLDMVLRASTIDQYVVNHSKELNVVTSFTALRSSWLNKLLTGYAREHSFGSPRCIGCPCW